MDLSQAVTDPDMAEPFIVVRSTGAFVAGGWKANPPQNIQGYGVISIASGADLDMVPEGDRIKESIVIHTTQELLLDNEPAKQMCDNVIWQGTTYRVYAANNFSNRNYWKALACRKAGN